MTSNEKTILYVDDDADDRELLWEAMQRVAPDLRVVFAENGLQALELLEEIKDAKSLPCLIVLDINMPYLNGRQTFARIKVNPKLNNIPLVILSSSESPADKIFFSTEDIRYFTKPIEFSALEDLARQIENLCT